MNFKDVLDSDDDEEEGPFKVDDLIWQPDRCRNEWLISRGKKDYVEFQDHERKQLFECFNDLDDDGSAEIGVQELEDPLIALGLVDNRQQVQKIVNTVDADGSGQIEFHEFLKIIKSGRKGGGASHTNAHKESKGQDESIQAIYSFFKDFTDGSMLKKDGKIIPF